MEKEAKDLSVAVVTGTMNRHSVHLPAPWQIFRVSDVTVTVQSARGYREHSRARQREHPTVAPIGTWGEPSKNRSGGPLTLVY